MQKGTAPLFLLIIALIIIVIGFFVFKSAKALPAKLQTPAIITSIKEKAPIYANQKLGLKFEYPKEFSVKEDSEEEFNKRGNGNYRKNFAGYVGYEPPEFLGAIAALDKDNDFEKSPLSIWVFNNPDNLTVEKWFNDFWYYPFVWGVFDYTSKGHIAMDQEATVSGQLAKYKVISYQPGSPKFIYVAFGKNMYLFRVIGESGDKILSSFKFLN